jgi:carboxymethylenebutenolidase
VVTTLQSPAPGGTAEAYVAGGTGRGVLFYIDAIGLRPRIADMVDRIASWGYVVLAPNVFYRVGRAADLAPTTDLREPGNRESFMGQAMARVHSYTTEQAEADAAAWVTALQERAPGPMGVVGFCMGARLAVRTAALASDVVVACAGFHGGGLVTDQPDSPHLLLPAARAEMVFGHADHDRSMTPAAVHDLGRALADAGLVATNEVYAGATHGYTMADTSSYDEAATERAFKSLRQLLARSVRK